MPSLVWSAKMEWILAGPNGVFEGVWPRELLVCSAFERCNAMDPGRGSPGGQRKNDSSHM